MHRHDNRTDINKKKTQNPKVFIFLVSVKSTTAMGTVREARAFMVCFMNTLRVDSTSVRIMKGEPLSAEGINCGAYGNRRGAPLRICPGAMMNASPSG